MADGAASGKFEVKSCGKAHAWCAVCRPLQAAAQRKPKAPGKVHTRPCRDCGRCDACFGIEAPEGMKMCRTCREVKPVEAFSRRKDTGGRRNTCMNCINSKQQMVPCEKCGKTFGRTTEARTLCAYCRPPLTKSCLMCGAEFVGSMDQRRYCSVECRQTALTVQRADAHRARRAEAFAAYSTAAQPSCACCGEGVLAFLSLDHVNGGGRAHRQETGGGGFYSWLKRHNYPAGFQVLCHNCNLGRQLNGGVCPHQTE